MDTGVSDAIEQLRGKLLDLTARNRLINYRHPKASSLRIVDERPAHIFKRLVQDTGSEEKPISLKLQPVSDPSADQARRYWDKAHPGVPWRDQRPDATTFAESLGIDVRFDITPDQGDVEKSPHHVDDRLQVLLYADELDARARRMRNSARTMIEETGSNSLFLVLGYLQWSESESSSSTYLAPLILVPIQLHEAQGRRGRREYSIVYTGQDLQPNLSLQKKLYDDFGLRLPEFARDSDPENYYREVRQRFLPFKPWWSIRRFVDLGFFDYGKILLWRESRPQELAGRGRAAPVAPGPSHSHGDDRA